MEKSRKHLIVVGGPTAVGKTSFSIKLAQHYGTEIISADSRQIFKKLDIGTAKPSKEELVSVPHHFIDVLAPEQEYNAGQFERDALALLENLFKEHKQVIVTGGSGMYVQALCQGIDEMPEIPLEVREQLNERLEREGLEKLLAELELADPAYYNVVDRHNPQRVVRALEVFSFTGLPFSSFRTKSFVKRPFNIIKIALDRPRKELYERIDLRMDQMIEEGLFEEAKELYPYRHLNALQTVGYKEIFDFIEGIYDKDEAIRLLKRNTRRYAKRQLTWFRKDPEFNWFHPDDIEEVIAFIKRQVEEKDLSGF